MNLFFLARRNLTLHLPTTLVQIAAMGAVCAVLVLWSGFADGFRTLVYRAATHLLLGEAEIHHAAYMRSESVYDTVPFDAALEKAITTENFSVAPRLYNYALAAGQNLSRGIKVVGIDADRERTVTDIHRHLASGSFIGAAGKRGVVVGSDLADALQLAVGGQIVIFGQAADGGLASDIFTVSGILLPVNGAVDQRYVYMDQADFRQFFLVEKGVHELVLRRLAQKGEIGDKIALDGVRKIYAGAAVEGWRELRPGLSAILDLLGYTLYGTLIFVYFALGSIVLNTKLMAVLDRQREYGVMQAVGMSRGQVVALTLIETMFGVAFASLLALAIAVPGALYLEQHGIDLSHVVHRIAYSEMMLDPVLQGHFGLWQFMCPFIFLWITAPLAALYPALIASRVDPASAIATGRSGR